jgi:hypothetical protein
MKGVLALYDVSAYIYTGMNSSAYFGYNVKGYPVGGMKYFVRHFTPVLMSMSDFAVMFDSGSFRKNIMSSYKSGRGSFHEVYSQLEILYQMLMKANIPCYKVDGYEADDLIFSAVEKSGDYSSIVIHSADYDVTHNVDERVSFEAVNSNVNNVNLGNFTYSVKKGVKLLPNTISAYKVFTGDVSDNIPNFVSETGIKGVELYERFCEYLKEKLKPYSVKVSKDKRALLIFLNDIRSELTESDMKNLKDRIEVVYPRFVDFDFKPVNRSSVDFNQYAKLLSLCNERQGLDILNKSYVDLTSEEVEFFTKKAKELRTGEFAADRALDLRTPDHSYEVLNLRDF